MKKGQKHDAGMIDPEEDAIEALRAFQDGGGAAIAAFITAMTRAWGEIGAEAASFMARRLEQDAEMQRRFLQCKDLDQLRHVQAEFVQRALDQYTEETGRMVAIGDRLMRAAAGRS